MEHIEFTYYFKDGDEVKENRVCKKADDGLHDYEVCEISYYVINGGSKEFFDWIDDEI